ncbi:MAG: TatD family hydrolase [bacterium]|nr:TatD family hydrolase [bacterium]
MIDTHCHLQIPPLADKLSQTIDQAKKQGVKKIIVPAVNSNDFGWFEDNINLDGLYFSLGIHPDSLMGHDWRTVKTKIIQLSQKFPQKIVAIGEIGLDTKINIPMDTQIKWFKQQINLAKQLNLPVIIHNRAASDVFKGLFNDIKTWPKAVFHAFIGKPDWLELILTKGFYVGLGGMITWANFNQQNWPVLQSFQDKIVLETDAPFLLPTILKGKERYNKPVNVKIIANFAAYKLGRSESDLETLTDQNSAYLFNLN